MHVPHTSHYAIVDIAMQWAERRRALLDKKQLYTLDEILRDVCNSFNMPIQTVKAQNRKREAVVCRQIYCYVSRLVTPHTFKTIGLHMGGRDHTTAIHANDMVKQFLEVKEPDFLKEWEQYITNSKLFKIEDFV
jgi:chromosomal replication initiator protein